MIFGALGDVHADFASVRKIMERHPDVPFWLSVGDVGDDEGRYEAPPAPLYWIKGNNEDFNFVAAAAQGTATVPNLHLIPNGRLVTVGPLRVAGLGGTFAPTWYDTAAADLPAGARARGGFRGPRSRHVSGVQGPPRVRPPRSVMSGVQGAPRVKDDKRRHFVRDEVDACKALRDVDLFLTHEAARPFFVFSGRGPTPASGSRGGLDAGKTPVNEVLAVMKPRLHLFGHHHRFDERTRQGVRSVCMDLVSRSYLLVESSTMEFEKRDT
jgi:hypothetical protein